MFGIGRQNTSGAEVRVGFRGGLFRVIEVGVGGLGVLGLGALGLKVLNAQPAQGFGLLKAWGPWPFVALVFLAIAGHFVNGLGDGVHTTFTSLVESSRQGAEAHTRTADALAKLAEQGGRQAEEVRRLAVYAGRELGLISERMDRQDAVMDRIASAVQGLHARLDDKHRG